MTRSIQSGYHNLIKNIGDILAKGRHKAYAAINNILVMTYWHIGKEIVDFEQHGSERADYGSDLLTHISRDLSERYGKGFSRSNVYIMRQFYFKYPKIQTVSGKLSWSHFVELLGVTDNLARGFYEKQCLRENWSVRELNRQINAMLFERLALSKDKKAAMALSKSGHRIEKDADIVKEPYVLEFLKIGNVDHLDIGQMNMYLNYFKKEEMAVDDKGPIGIILAADKDEVLVEYALGGISNKFFVSKYQLYLPDKKQLQSQLRKLI